MANNYNVSARLEVVNRFTQPLQQFRQQMSGIRSTVNSATQTVNSFNQSTSSSANIEALTGKIKGLIGAFAGLSTIKKAVSSALDFQDDFAKVKTIMDETEVGYDEMKKAIMELSSQTGVSASEISDNVYNAISAGQKTGDAINFVNSATNLAKAGFTSSASALDVLSTTMNAYKLSADEVGNVSDKLIMTQNLGKTTVDELASSMGKIIPTANAFGVDLDNLCGGYAKLTANGIATAESTTYMNSMINELGKSGTQVSEIIKSKTGKSFKDFMGDGNSLADALEILNESAKASGKQFSDLWSSSEAGKAGLVLLGDGADEFNDILEYMYESSGATESALEKLQTVGSKLRKIGNNIKNVFINLGGAMLPIVNVISDISDSFMQYVQNINFDDVQNKVQNFVDYVVANKDTIIGVIKGIIPIVIGLTTAIAGFKIFKKVEGYINSFKNAIALATSPIGLTIIAIAALVAGLIYAYKHSEKFRDIVNNAWASVQEKVKVAVDNIISLIQAVQVWLEEHQTFVQAVKNTIIAIVETAINTIGGIIEGIGKIISGIVDVVTGVIMIIEGIIKGDWSKVWEGAKTIVQGAIDIIKGLWKGLVELLSHPIDIAVNITKKIFGGGDDSGSETEEVGHNAHGVNSWRGGLTYVNENEKGELINLPNGSQVIPNDLSKRLIDQKAKSESNEKTISINIPKLADSIIVREDADIEKIGQAIFNKIKLSGMSMA